MIYRNGETKEEITTIYDLSASIYDIRYGRFVVDAIIILKTFHLNSFKYRRRNRRPIPTRSSLSRPNKISNKVLRIGSIILEQVLVYSL